MSGLQASAKEALQKLQDGNARFVDGDRCIDTCLSHTRLDEHLAVDLKLQALEQTGAGNLQNINSIVEMIRPSVVKLLADSPDAVFRRAAGA